MEPLSMLMGAAAGAGAAAIIARSSEHRTEPAGLADELQWAFMVDDGVVLEKDGALMAGFRYRGPDLGSATAAELDALGAHVNDALLPYGDGWMFHVDSVRTAARAYAGSHFPDLATAWIDAERRAAFRSFARSGRPQFVSDQTITVTYLPPRDVYSRAAGVFVQGEPAGVDWALVLSGFRAALHQLEQRLSARLWVRRLDSDGLVRHLHHCLTGLPHPVRAPEHGAYLNAVLASQEFVGGFAPRVGALHLRLVAITGYPASAQVGQLDVLSSLPFPYRWSNRFIPVGQLTAAKMIRRHQRQWFMGRKGAGSFLSEMTSKGDRSARQQETDELFHDQDSTQMTRDAADAAAENSSGAVRFGYVTQTVVVHDEDPRRADAAAAAVLSALNDNGFTARVETVNAVDAFFGTLPGHGYPNLRRPLMHSRNIAALWPLTGVWPGLAYNPSPFFPPESPPLMHVATGGSTPFRLNLHVADLGHTLLVGAPGAGKSTFVNLTVAQWQRYEGAQTFVFDVGYSHWLLCEAAGGQHYDIGGGGGANDGEVGNNGSCHITQIDALAFQPLADVNRAEERAWATGWLEMLLELQGLEVTPARRVALDRAVRLLAAEPREHRTLTELTVQVQDFDLKEALQPYTVGGAYGRLLDANSDALDEGDGTRRYQVFELRALYDLDDKILVPTLLYLFRRVERQLEAGRPTLIVIEEMWGALMRTVFADRLKQWLLTLRKQNAAVMLVAHTLAQLDQVPAKQVIIESCLTRILLPNADAVSSANATLYQEIGCNDREIGLIAGAIPKRDYYVKSPIGSRMVQLDLGPVALSFLSTPEGLTIDAMRPIVAALADQYGEHWPRVWLDRLKVSVPPEVMSLRAVTSQRDRALPGPAAVADDQVFCRADRSGRESHTLQAVPVQARSERREEEAHVHAQASHT